MISVRNITLAFLLVPVFAVAQNCSGDYTWVQNGLNVNFYGNTTPNITNITWDFGDGNFDFSNSLSVSHTYATPGTYQACIQYSDSVSACVDSTCHIIVIDSCYGSFTYTVNGGTVNFTGYGNGATGNAVYHWSFGDNQTSSQQNPSHGYAQPGIYTVCFSYYDNTTGCSDSICQPVYVGQAACLADFTWIDSVGYVFFVNNSTPGNTGTYMWDFGDGNYSTQYNPSHAYANAGTYTVCLIAYDSAGNFCDSTCHNLSVTNVASVQNISNAILSLNISPNPAGNTFTISYAMFNAGEISISILDLSGRTIRNLARENETAGQHAQLFSTDGIPSGIYFIRVKNNNSVIYSKLLIAD